MFLAKNNDFIVYATNTLEEMQATVGFDYTYIEETQDEYILKNGQYVKVDDEYIEQQLEQAKQAKLAENQQKRDKRIAQGIVYKDVLFDADTDQKVNLIFKSSQMSDTETINWYGQDGFSKISCTKQEIFELGGIIGTLLSKIWENLNPEYISKINNAKTIDELDAINIDYGV